MKILIAVVAVVVIAILVGMAGSASVLYLGVPRDFAQIVATLVGMFIAWHIARAV